MDEDNKTCDDATSFTNTQGRQARVPKARIVFSKDELDSLKRKEPAGFDMEVVGRKIADANGKASNLVEGLRRDTFDSYASIRHDGDQKLLAVGSRL